MERQNQITTIPNALTLGRLLLAPMVAHKLRDNPKRWWWRTALFMASDNLDGILARLEYRSDRLRNLGFRRSIIGAKLDPITDRITGSCMVHAGVESGTIPRALAAVAIGQKVVSSAYGVYATAQGLEIEVNLLGKRSEFATNIGLGMLNAAENIDNVTTKRVARAGCIAISVTGITGAAVNTYQYWQSNQQ